MIYICMVKKLSESEAMEEIFNSHILSASERTMKSRYNRGLLSKKAVDQILLDNGFEVVQEKLYSKKV